MQKLIVFIVIFVLWFVLWTGVGFKILEWISTDLVMEAFENSSAWFANAYSWSAAQWKVNEQKAKITASIKDGIMEYVKGKLGMEAK